MVAKYECKCGYKWKVYQTRGGLKTCKMCLKESWPYELQWPKKNVSTYLGRTKKRCVGVRGVWLSPSNIVYTLSVQVTMHFGLTRRNQAIVECSGFVDTI